MSFTRKLSKKCIIYQANIYCDITGYKQKCYLGSLDRFQNHKKSFKHVKRENETQLSKEFWKKRIWTQNFAWKIDRICCSYNPNSKHCLLCLNEKYEIATYKGDTCRQGSKYKFANCCDTTDWPQIHTSSTLLYIYIYIYIYNSLYLI